MPASASPPPPSPASSSALASPPPPLSPAPPSPTPSDPIYPSASRTYGRLRTFQSAGPTNTSPISSPAERQRSDIYDVTDADADDEDDTPTQSRVRLMNSMKSDTPARAPRKLKKTIAVERPGGSAQLWYTVSEEDWGRMRPKRRATLSHVGHIMGDNGMTPDTYCDRCWKDPDRCRVYNNEAKQQFMRLGGGCARCRYDGKFCSFKVCTLIVLIYTHCPHLPWLTVPRKMRRSRRRRGRTPCRERSTTP